MTVNQTMIDEIVANVLAKLQPMAARPVIQAVKPAVNLVSNVVPQPVMLASKTVESKLNYVELTGPVITAEILEGSVSPGQALRIGRTSILTPSARDWLHNRRTAWSRQDRSSIAAGASGSGRVRWQVILQTITPTVRALHDGLRRMTEGWKIELVGHPAEAASLAMNLVSTSECEGVVVFTEQAELIACKVNRNERVRAAVVQNNKQWEQVVRTMSANVVCISPIGKTFIELRNLLRDCAATNPRSPAGW